MKNKIFISLLFIIVSLFIFQFILSKMPYIPKPVLQLTEDFIKYSQSNNLEAAYELTVKKGLVGNNLPEFKTKTYKEWGVQNASDIRKDSAKFSSISPIQSYGNRLRRWFMRKEMETPEVVVDYHVGILPFSVTCQYRRNHQWKVLNFQSHAE